jgi:hypothetical protein
MLNFASNSYRILKKLWVINNLIVNFFWKKKFQKVFSFNQNSYIYTITIKQNSYEKHRNF